MKRLVLFLVLVIFQSEAIVNHNPVKPGCPPVVTPKENLLLERFTGVWYEIQKYSNQFELGTCISINIGFVRELNASTVSIRHNQKVGDNFTDFDQTAQVKSLNSVWSFKNNSSLIADVDGFIYILDTNYVNYAVIFACGIINKKQNGQMVWILSRSRTMQPEFLNKSIEALVVNQIKTKFLIIGGQTNCSLGIDGF